MNQKFDVNHAIKTIRWMAFGCSAMLFMYSAASLLLLTNVHSKGYHASTYATQIVSILTLTAVALIPVQAALHGVFHVFRSQQSEIDQLKAAMEQQRGAERPAQTM